MRFKWGRTWVPRAVILLGAILLGIVIGANAVPGILGRHNTPSASALSDLIYCTAASLFVALGLAAIEFGIDRQHELDRNLLDTLLEYIPDSVFFKDRESRFLRISRAMARHCNLSDPNLALHKTDADIFTAEHALQALADECLIVETGKPLIEKEEKETWPDGHETWALTTMVPLKNRLGRTIGTMGFARNITERKEAALRMQHIALHDPVTGLPNRVLFEEKLEEAIAEAGSDQKRVAVLILDLDRFRSVNETLGYGAGDRLLKLAAERLRANLPEGYTVARIGGDEFAIIVPDLPDEGQLEELPHEIREVFSAPFQLESNQLRLSAGIGIALYPDNGDGSDNLLRSADFAVYEAKRKGCGRHSFYSPAFSETNGRQQKLELELLEANAHDEFVLHYQPFVESHSGRITGVEALLRWQHPEHGLLPPGQFIPLVEKLGLMQQVGRWALRAACYQAFEWQRMGLGSIRMAVNVSSQQFDEDNIVDAVLEVLTEVGMEPKMLELELTESQVLDESEATIGTMRRLKRIGVSLALDDFGTGWSSLAYLRRFPLDRLKIGSSFVRDLGSERTADEVVKSVLGLGKSLGLACIAEGVETSQQYAHLRSLGCPEMQGFHFSRPLPAVGATALLRSAKFQIRGSSHADARAVRVSATTAAEVPEKA